MRERVDQLGVAEPRSSARAPTRSTSRCPTSTTPTRRPRRSARPPSCTSTTGRRTSSGRTASPTRRTRRSPAARRPATASRPRCRSTTPSRGAPKCPPTNTGKETSGGQYYLVDKKTKKVLAGPAETARDLQKRGACNKKIPFDANAGRQGPAGHDRRPRRAGRPQGQAAARLLRPARPAGAQRHGHQEPRAELRQRPGRHRRAERHVRLHRQGREGVAEDHARDRPARPGALARRAARRVLQHFAIVLDDELISAPYIDFQQNPDGIDGGERLARSPAASRSSPRRTWRTC